jgi:hypothetical protein
MTSGTAPARSPTSSTIQSRHSIWTCVPGLISPRKLCFCLDSRSFSRRSSSHSNISTGTSHTRGDERERASTALSRASGGYPNVVRQAGPVIRCVECGAESDDLAFGWRGCSRPTSTRRRESSFSTARIAQEGRSGRSTASSRPNNAIQAEEERWDSLRSTSSLAIRRARR